ncbi:MAG: LamG domain-containing protein [Ottowia sp.]|uniref:N,N-dimethylformamidase beta subunit family domain-containing protein n=1 Tax=Ottowia sp. TaxID=1898956 RepID=UPI0039E50504
MPPPHRALELPGLHAYADQISVEAGDRIALHVSADVPYTVSLCRLGPDLNGPSTDEVLATQACPAPQAQPIHPGSCVHVPHGLPAQAVASLGFECWMQIWGLAGWQCVFSQMEQHAGADAGFGLFVDPAGHLALGCGAAPLAEEAGRRTLLRSPQALPLRQWLHVAATLEHGHIALWVNGARVADAEAAPSFDLADGPIRLGACGVHGRTDLFFEGDLAMPALYRVGLDAAAIAQRFQGRGLSAPDHPDLLACWPLDEMHGDRVRDLGPHGRHGRLINHGTRLINGPAFDPAEVPRYRDDTTPADARLDPRRAGLRLASDDLVDCGWRPTHAFALPADARSGLYVGRFEFQWQGQPARYDVTFVVRRARHRAAPKLLVLCATNTWLAYAASPFAATHPQPAVWPRRSTGLPNSHPLAPRQCTYGYHRAGQPTYHAGLRMPRPNAAPYELYDPEGSGFAQWTRLERQLHVWLDAHGYDYDLASDLDLHRNPDLLKGYHAVIVNGHSEYWSQPACDGLDHYLRQGGCAVVLSGNSMYWRVSFDEGCTVMEQRKTRTPHDGLPAGGDDVVAPAGPHGEQYHSQDGRRGGLWRFAGQSCARLIGLETAGWGFAEPRDFGVYRVRDAAHPLFTAPFATGLRAGDTFGHGPGGSLPRAIGHEWDLTTATLMRMTRRVPEDADRPLIQPGIEVIAEGIRPTPGRLDAYLDYFEAPTVSLDGLSCEMIVWQRPEGGRVFNAGAVGASWVLGVDGRMGRLLANVLSAFSVPYPPRGPYAQAPAEAATTESA